MGRKAILTSVWLVVMPLVCWAAEPAKPAGAEESKAETEEELEQVVVTATRTAQPVREVANSVTVVRGKDIERRGKISVGEALRGLPGLDVVNSGGRGRNTSIFTRGAPSEFTLVLLDGVEVADAISVGRSYDFAHLGVENIDRVEVLRGPQSTLYGSDAMGGVINIITRRGQGPLKAYATAEGGSFSTFRQSVGLSGGTELYHYSLGASLFETDGVSSARKDNGNDEEDPYESASFSGRFGLSPVENLEIDLFVRYIDAESHIDGWDFVASQAADDLDHLIKYEQLFLRGQVRTSLFDGLWEQTLGVSSSDHDRDETNDQDDPNDNILKAAYNGRILKLDWQNDLRLHETNTLTLGFEIENERGESLDVRTFGGFLSETVFKERDEQTLSFYAQDQVKLWERLFVNLGVRHDEHQRFGSETTWRAAAAYVHEPSDTKLRASYGTGFKAPSLFQLHYAFGGNLDLDPQKSEGWDLGLDQEVEVMGRPLSFGVTWFRNDFDDMIDYEFATSSYKNIAEVDTEGLELYARTSPTDSVDLRFYYTYTQAEDRITGRDLSRRAKNKYSAEASYLFLEEKASLSLGVDFVGDHPDAAANTVLESYTVVNLAAAYRLNERLKLFGRVENLFDEDYEEVSGYGVPGIAAYFGLKVSF